MHHNWTRCTTCLTAWLPLAIVNFLLVTCNRVIEDRSSRVDARLIIFCPTPRSTLSCLRCSQPPPLPHQGKSTMKSIGESRLHTRFLWTTQVADEEKSGFITLSVDDTKMASFEFFEFCLMYPPRARGRLLWDCSYWKSPNRGEIWATKNSPWLFF